MEVDPSTLGAAVPNMILQPLLENAVRHAIEPQETGGQIHLRSMRDNGRLLLQISDNGPGLTAQSSQARRQFSSSGFTITNPSRMRRTPP